MWQGAKIQPGVTLASVSELRESYAELGVDKAFFSSSHQPRIPLLRADQRGSRVRGKPKPRPLLLVLQH